MSPNPNRKSSMNAAITVCNVSVSLTLLEPISRAQSKYKSSIRGRRTINPIHLLPRSSPIIETVEAQAPSESESVARRLILLRHAMSSWEDPSLRGTRSLLSTLYSLLHMLENQDMFVCNCPSFLFLHRS